MTRLRCGIEIHGNKSEFPYHSSKLQSNKLARKDSKNSEKNLGCNLICSSHFSKSALELAPFKAWGRERKELSQNSTLLKPHLRLPMRLCKSTAESDIRKICQSNG